MSLAATIEPILQIPPWYQGLLNKPVVTEQHRETGTHCKSSAHHQAFFPVLITYSLQIYTKPSLTYACVLHALICNQQ